jgi:homoserine kinase
MLQKITVKIPATTANLGPGFDCLGMAIDIWNHVQFQEEPEQSIHVIGEGEDSLSTKQSNLVYKAAKRYFDEFGLPMPSTSITCWNGIPIARGLGSSSAAIIGGLLGASALAGEQNPNLELIWKLAVEIEGHADNVTPALFGGCQIVVRDQSSLVRAPVSIPNYIRTVLFMPDLPMDTSNARDVLPQKVSREDAVYNIGRVALLINAFSTGRDNDLRVATQDQLHQPARQNLLPSMRMLFKSALAAGAIGVFLSGSGSTVLALTHGTEISIAYEMAEAANRAGVSGRVKITRPSANGAQITREG